MKPLAFKYGKGKPATALKGVQPRLSLNKSGDRFEREADEMAAKVTQLPQQDTSVIARSLGRIKPAGTNTDVKTADVKNKGGQDQLMRKAAGSSGITAPSVRQLGSSPGSPLPSGVRRFMENAFSRDFSAVRLHTDEEAATMSRDIGARAFTHHNDIYFNKGQFAPHSPEGKKLLAHELTHVVQQHQPGTTPDLQRTIELRPPGRGEASAFERVQELIDRLNAQSAAVRYRLEGPTLQYDIIDEAGMTHFDRQMQAFIDRQQLVRMRLITSEGRGRPNQNAPFEPIFIDFFDAGYVDLEDLLATDNLSFQTNMLHILAERFATRDYNRRIGTAFSDAEFRRAHAAGLEAEAANFRDLFDDPSIRFSYDEVVGRRFMVVFRSTAEGFQIFVLFRNAAAAMAQSEVRVRTRSGQWFTGEAFRQRRAEAGPLVQPQLQVNKADDPFEREADAIAEKIVQHPGSKKVQKPLRKHHDTNGSPAPAAVAAALQSSKGYGMPLPESIKAPMEAAFSSDLSSVRLHTDQQAATMSRDMQAHAFTYGSDIYFNSGQYRPWSIEGKRLLAHELVHVVQQGGGGQDGHMRFYGNPSIQREEDQKPEAEVDNWFVLPPQAPVAKQEEVAGGQIDARNKKNFILLNRVRIAKQLKKFINTAHYTTIPIRGDRPTDQRQIWKKQPLADTVVNKIIEKGKEAQVKQEAGEEVYYFFKTLKAGQKGKTRGEKQKLSRDYIIGNLEDIKNSIVLPTWNKQGTSISYDVDHQIEWQIGGKHEMANFWLWESSANRSAGSKLNNEINRQIETLVLAAINAGKIWKVPKGKKKETVAKEKTRTVRKQYSITIVNLDPALEVSGFEEEHYEKEEVFEQGLPLMGLKPMEKKEIDKLQGTKNMLSVMFGNTVSLNPKKVPKSYKGKKENWISGFDLTAVTDYNVEAKPGEPYAYLSGKLFQRQKDKKLMKVSEVKVPIIKIPGPLYFGKIPGRLSEFITVEPVFKPFSPIKVTEAYMDETEGVVVAGKVVPTIPFLKDFDIDVLIKGNDIVLSKTFMAEELGKKLPKLFTITGGSLTVTASLEGGVGVDGQLDFSMGNLGTGFIRGEVNKDLFALTGGFEFEKGFFDQSSIRFGYERKAEEDEGRFFFEGYAEKKASRENKAIQYARVDLKYENDVLDAKGIAKTGLPGIKEGTIQVITGGAVTSVEADFIIGDRIPGVTGGKLHFLFMKMEDGSYQIAASSEILTKFPGIPMVSLKGFYKSDGTFLFEGDALLKKDRFAGTVHFGITNQEVDEKGQLTGKKGNKLLAFGSGEVFFQMNKWLGGKINATITPDARVVLGGELRPDPLIPITKEAYKVNKPLGSFSLPKFTLFGIPRVAEVYVTASGYILFFASLGPVYLKGAFLRFDRLDIEHPEGAVITGGGSLDIPGEAGLTLGAIIRAGVGILVVDVSLFLNGNISFMVRGNAGLDIQFEWSADKGFSLKESTAYLKATSELVASLSGGVTVKLDLLLTTIELYEKKWKLGEKRWPLGLDLNLNFPLAFGGEGGENIALPEAGKIKHEEPKFEQDTVKQAVMDEPPDISTAPGKEEALRRIRILPADATTSFNFYSGIFERYNYVKGLKKKYPSQDWSYLDAELPNLDAKDLQALRAKIFEVPGLMGRSATEMRLFVLSEFEERHRYLQPNEVGELKNQIVEAGKKREE